ncbi:MAG: hypothetical protein NZV14_07960 [Bryobacteraceae bacterium]|nr:hypothetical protein [Bryobacteraceae bacterium]MDW8378081.1 hypothetical protein [Bryobacterales bacterium]
MAGQSDPWGTARASNVTNPSVSEQRVFQVLPIPAGFHYCLSVFLRAAEPEVIGLGIEAAGRQLRKDVRAESVWRRYSVSGSVGGTGDEVECGVYVPSGASIDLVGMQLEAQLGVSHYRETDQQGGVYSNARFVSDRLMWTTEGLNAHSTVIEVVGW